MFADTDAVAARLGRDLTEGEEGIAESVIESITLQIAEAVDRDADWADELDPIPATFTALCVEKSIAAIANPLNVASQSETMGSWNSSQTFPRAQDVGALLTAEEESRIRKAWFGQASGSARLPSMVDDILDIADDGEINDSVAA